MFPVLSAKLRTERLTPPAPGSAPVRAVLDTDTFNEVDDQFAVVHAMRSPDRISLDAIYAAPFFNDRSTGPGDGMEKSYEEILRLTALMGATPPDGVLRGSTCYLPGPGQPVESAAAADLVRRAHASPDPLYVIAIGAITNVASALLLDPSIVEKIVVVWLGGNALHWPNTREFNLQQDVAASRTVLDSGVPLILLPCMGTVQMLHTSIPELAHHLKGHGPLADFLFSRVRDYGNPSMPTWSKVIWDIAATSWLVDPGWCPSTLQPSPVLRDDLTWGADDSRHEIRIVREVHRDPIFRDVFQKITNHAPILYSR